MKPAQCHVVSIGSVEKSRARGLDERRVDEPLVASEGGRQGIVSAIVRAITPKGLDLRR
jgi:hypothetical protein